MPYLPRIVDSELSFLLKALGGVVIEGPKACGKTATARQAAASEVLLDVDQNARMLLETDPGKVLEGPTPRLIDEWQVEPDIWNYIRRAIDDRQGPGQFILTGSAIPADNARRHSGAGRLTRLRMRPMTLFETGHSIGSISLKQMLEGEKPSSAEPGLSFTDLVEQIAIGGWPGVQKLPLSLALSTNTSYITEIARMDIEGVDNVQRDPIKVGQLLQSLARNVATYASINSLAKDTSHDQPLSRHTVAAYLQTLERLMITEDQPPWATHLRSSQTLRHSSKRHFVDPSLAVAALRATPTTLLNDLNCLGFLFESLVVRDIRTYAQANDAQVFQYRDSSDLEVDCIVQKANGDWGAFEVKLGWKQVDNAAASLNKFAAKVDTSKRGTPKVLGVITATGYGYLRKDGVAVIPIGALCP